MLVFETVAAISTPPGNGGVAVIRISGPNARSALTAITDIDPLLLPPRALRRADILCKEGLLDRALVCYMPSPHSFTGEDIVEIHCHGSHITAHSILNELISAGVKQASAGEFTRRAFLNGKIDLTEAEAIGDMLEAQTRESMLQAASGLRGALPKRTGEIRERLSLIASHILAMLDFSEEGLDELPYDEIREGISKVYDDIEELLATADYGILVRRGVRIALVGAPNGGKSSLMNRLLGEERAIVTPIAGTTRDVIRENANIDGYLVTFCDTAGMRETENEIEKIGIQRSSEEMEEADLILLVASFDAPMPELVTDKPCIMVWNKSDIDSSPPKEGFLRVSSLTGEGIEELCARIVGFVRASAPKSPERATVTNERQEALLRSTAALLRAALSDMGDMITLDVILTSLEQALATLGEMTGENVSRELIEEVFSRFCVGK